MMVSRGLSSTPLLARRTRTLILFFFQAEDGIRDIGVTGVQTCALPICRQPRRATAPVARSPTPGDSGRRLNRALLSLTVTFLGRGQASDRRSPRCRTA